MARWRSLNFGRQHLPSTHASAQVWQCTGAADPWANKARGHVVTPCYNGILLLFFRCCHWPLQSWVMWPEDTIRCAQSERILGSFFSFWTWRDVRNEAVVLNQEAMSPIDVRCSQRCGRRAETSSDFSDFHWGLFESWCSISRINNPNFQKCNPLLPTCP